MNPETKTNRISNRTLSVGIAFVLVALIAGIYFLFKPFPAGPSLAVNAKVPEAASIRGWSAYANPPARLQEAGSLKGWSAYANAPVVVKEAASVVGWSAYANPPKVVKPTADRPLRRR